MRMAIHDADDAASGAMMLYLMKHTYILSNADDDVNVLQSKTNS